MPDHGSHYTSYDFAITAGNANVGLSFGSVGDAFDNAAIVQAGMSDRFGKYRLFTTRQDHQTASPNRIGDAIVTPG
jgi:hypothetical protein